MSPVLGFTTPFLARKGDGGMAETVVGHRRYRSGAGFEAPLRPRPGGRRIATESGSEASVDEEGHMPKLKADVYFDFR